MDGFPGEIILVFGGLALLMLGAALCDIINYIKEKAPEGRRRIKTMFIKFRKTTKRTEEILSEAMLCLVEKQRAEIKRLKRTITELEKANELYLKDNCEYVNELSNLKRDLNALEEENVYLHNCYKEALKANGQIKRQAAGRAIPVKKEGAVNA